MLNFNIKVLTSLCLLFSISVSLFAQNYRVQIAAFPEQVPFTRFLFSGVNDIYANVDQNEIHRYYLSENFYSSQEAEEARKTLVRREFNNAQIIDMVKEKSLCKANDPAADQGVIYTNINTEHLYIRHLYFGFSRSSLSIEAKESLDEIFKKLKRNPRLLGTIQGHTDASGSPEFNLALSIRRARAARNYLVAKGIHFGRIKIKVFGESTPVAINVSVDGKDEPDGRKYNRRVVVVLTDQYGEVVNDIERMRDVPGHLRINKQTLRQQLIYADSKR